MIVLKCCAGDEAYRRTGIWLRTVDENDLRRIETADDGVESARVLLEMSRFDGTRDADAVRERVCRHRATARRGGRHEVRAPRASPE